MLFNRHEPIPEDELLATALTYILHGYTEAQRVLDLRKSTFHRRLRVAAEHLGLHRGNLDRFEVYVAYRQYTDDDPFYAYIDGGYYEPES